MEIMDSIALKEIAMPQNLDVENRPHQLFCVVTKYICK